MVTGLEPVLPVNSWHNVKTITAELEIISVSEHVNKA